MKRLPLFFFLLCGFLLAFLPLKMNEWGVCLILKRFGCLETQAFSIPEKIGWPKKILPLGPTERIFSKVLALFPLSHRGLLVTPSGEDVPFSVDLRGGAGSFRLHLKDSFFEVNWDEGGFESQFESLELSLFSPLLTEAPLHEKVTGTLSKKKSWCGAINFSSGLKLKADEEGVFLDGNGWSWSGDIIPIFSSSGNWNLLLNEGKGRFRVEGEEIIYQKLWARLESKGVFIQEGEAYWKGWEVKIREGLFSEGSLDLSGEAYHHAILEPFEGLSLKEVRAPFMYKGSENSLSGEELNANLSFLGRSAELFINHWHWDQGKELFFDGFTDDMEVKGFFDGPSKLHLVEGSCFKGIEVGPLLVAVDSAKKIESLGGFFSAPFKDLIGLLDFFEYPSTPFKHLQGDFEGYLFYKEGEGEVVLEARDLFLGEFPLASARLEGLFNQDRIEIREGKLEELIFSCELIRNEKMFMIPFWGLEWRDFIHLSGTGTLKEDLFLSLDTFELDLEALDFVPHWNRIGHAGDLKGKVSGSGWYSSSETFQELVVLLSPGSFSCVGREILMERGPRLTWKDKIGLVEDGLFKWGEDRFFLREGLLNGDEFRYLEGKAFLSAFFPGVDQFETPCRFENGVWKGFLDDLSVDLEGRLLCLKNFSWSFEKNFIFDCDFPLAQIHFEGEILKRSVLKLTAGKEMDLFFERSKEGWSCREIEGSVGGWSASLKRSSKGLEGKISCQIGEGFFNPFEAIKGGTVSFKGLIEDFQNAQGVLEGEKIVLNSSQGPILLNHFLVDPFIFSSNGVSGKGEAEIPDLFSKRLISGKDLPFDPKWLIPRTGKIAFQLNPQGGSILKTTSIFSEGKGIRYEVMEGNFEWDGHFFVKLRPKSYRLPLYWIEKGVIVLFGTFDQPRLEFQSIHYHPL